MNNEKHTQIFALVAALILAAVLASGCSTQPADDSTGKTYSSSSSSGSTIDYTNLSSSGSTSTASSSYIRCVNVMTAYGQQTQCYQVSGLTASSYDQYVNSKVGFAKGVSQENLQQGYVAYLSSLDADAAADMQAQYDAIVAAYTK